MSCEQSDVMYAGKLWKETKHGRAKEGKAVDWQTAPPASLFTCFSMVTSFLRASLPSPQVLPKEQF